MYKRQVLFFCDNCQEVFLGSKNATQPVTCPKCDKQAGYRATECTECSLVYSYNQKECPHCKKALPRKMLKTLKEVAEARKKHQEYLKREKEMEEYENEN